MLTTLLLLLFLPLDTSKVHQNIELYQANIEKEVQIAESIWALTRTYHAGDSTKKETILNKLSNSLLKTELEVSADIYQAIHSLNKFYKDEHLLLYLLLHTENLHERETLFETFYTATENNQLQEINRQAKYGNVVSRDLLSQEEADFEHFLIYYYDIDNNIKDDRFYKEFVNYWINNKNLLSTDRLVDELHLVILFTELYSERNFSKIDLLSSNFFEVQRLPYSILSRNFYWDLEFSFYQNGYVEKSLEVQREHLIPIAEYLGNQEHLHRIYSSHGGYLYLIGNYLEAREVFNTSLENIDEISDSHLTLLYNNLSLVYYKTGENRKYIETQLQALEHAQSLENNSRILTIYRNLQIFYAKNKNWDLASQYIDLAEELALDVENYQELISIYVSKAEMEFQHLNNIENAFNYLEKAQSHFNSDTEIRTRVRVLYEKAKLLNKNQEYTDSRELLTGIISDWSSELNTPAYLDILLQIANVEYLLGNRGEAQRLLQEFLAHDISVVEFPKLVQSKRLQATLLAENGDYRGAEELYSRTAGLVLERARNSADFESGYWMVEQEYLNLFESYVDFLLKRDRQSEALTLLDRVKTINDATLLENPLVKSARLSEEELARERQITEEMDEIRKKLFTASGSDRLQLQNELERLNAQRRELTQDLDIEEREDKTPVWSIQRNLNGHQKILHITEINDHYYVSRVTKTSVDIEKKQITDSHTVLFEGAIDAMVRGRTDLEKLYEVGQFLNLSALRPSIRSLIVMPDGYFHQLPIDVIPREAPDTPISYGSADYMIEHFQIRTLNHLGDMHRRSTSSEYQYDFTGFGISDFQNERTNRNLISLPKAPGEVASISNRLNRFQQTNTFIEDNATPNSFRQHAGNSKILHMASHSEISESDPLFSRLHLSPSSLNGTDDEIESQLFAYQLFDLNLNNRMIMLNSCESGTGRHLQGSGIMGISRALRYAGAQSLVLNAWSVNDQFAADFADIFYEHINSGKSKSKALQATKVHFIQHKNANPHFWGPYILNGDNDPLIRNQTDTTGQLVLAFAFVAGLILVSKEKLADRRAA